MTDLVQPSEHDYSNPSWTKIRGAMQQAAKDGHDYIWIDTLCIDKSSSAELSEAINSMYQWYEEAEVCYVYLADLSGCPPLRGDCVPGSEILEYWTDQLKACRWFKRGWYVVAKFTHCLKPY